MTRRKVAGPCAGCGAEITTQSRTGHCRSCALARTNANPVSQARKAKVNRDRVKDPAYRAKLARTMAANGRKARRDPEFMARLSAIGRAAAPLMFTPEARAKWLATRAEAARKRTATMLPWCPEEYLEEYRKLRGRGNMTAATAKAAILAKLTPFERQMHAVKRGAGLVMRPTIARSYDYTLAGGSPL